MSVTRWVIGGSTFDINPDKDSGWEYEEVRSEQHPINSNTTVIQSAGFKSPTRTIEGFTHSRALRDALVSLYLAARNVTCSDQDGASFTGRLLDCKFPVRINVANEANNFQSYYYHIVIAKR